MKNFCLSYLSVEINMWTQQLKFLYFLLQSCDKSE